MGCRRIDGPIAEHRNGQHVEFGYGYLLILSIKICKIFAHLVGQTEQS